MVLRGNKYIVYDGKRYKFLRTVTREQMEKFKTFEAAHTFYFKVRKQRNVLMYVRNNAREMPNTIIQGQTYLTKRMEF